MSRWPNGFSEDCGKQGYTDYHWSISVMLCVTHALLNKVDVLRVPIILKHWNEIVQMCTVATHIHFSIIFTLGVQKSIHVSDILKFEFISSKILMKHFPCSALHKGLLWVISVETMQPALTPAAMFIFVCMWGVWGGENGEGFSGTKWTIESWVWTVLLVQHQGELRREFQKIYLQASSKS